MHALGWWGCDVWSVLRRGNDRNHRMEYTSIPGSLVTSQRLTSHYPQIVVTPRLVALPLFYRVTGHSMTTHP